MLIIPLSQKLTLQNFPFVTVLLVVINLLVYFVLQLPDERVTREYAAAYAKAGVGEQELPVYTGWLAAKGKSTAPPTKQELSDPRYLAAGGVAIQHDRQFQGEFASNMRQKLTAEQFATWQTARVPLDAIWQKNFTERYIFVPALARAEAVLSHMFMHADLGHLFGNMVMLVLIGLLVESAVGGWRVAAIYLVGGAGALALYTIFSPDRWVGMLGASGAIAAMMGACAALYGLRRVRFFYHVLFYFDFLTLPAIVVLPLWIGNELWQWFHYRHESNVAYFAHIGGLIAGATFSLLFRQTVTGRLRAAATPSLEKTEDLARLHARAYANLKKMQWDAAGREFEQLLQQAPSNLDYAKQLYTVSRAAPASDRYHLGAKQLIKLACKNDASELFENTIAEYWKRAQPTPRLATTDIVRYAKLLAKNGAHGSATMLADVLLKLPAAKISPHELADVVLAIAVALHRSAGDESRRKSQQYIAILESRFVGSEQLKLARQLIPV